MQETNHNKLQKKWEAKHKQDSRPRKYDETQILPTGKKTRAIGTWADSMSDFLWHYEGTVEGNKLILNTEGPDPSDPSKMIKARDTWDFKSKDLVVLTSQMVGPDGMYFAIFIP